MRSYSRDKNVVLEMCALFCGLKMCALFSAVLILYVRSLFCGLLTKKCGLNQRYPKHAVLKVPISQPQQGYKLHLLHNIFIDLATCHYSLTLTLSLSLHTLSKLPQISPFFKNSPFSGRARQIPFFSWPKIPFFNAQNSTYIRATDLQTGFLRSTDSVDSSDTVSFTISAKLGEL